MAHEINSMIKCEIDSVHHNSISVINKSSTLIGGNSAANPTATAMTAQPNESGSASHSGAGNARTGSRRIFAPQFKLQVLESYRNDSDCKGNQRATARKYGIHRRQIQKWLQSEKSLRASVANYSQNNVKHHQFHNITHHQMTVSPSCTAATAIGAAPTAAATTTPAPAIAQTATVVNTHTTSGAYSHNNNHLHYHHRHSQHHQAQAYKTALDTARHSVALSSSPPTAAATAPTKCMNGLPLTQPGAQTHTLPVRQAYTQTPAIKPMLILTHQQHQSALHQHHHQLHHSQRQLENVRMPSECLLERSSELLENQSINAARSCYENFHRPQPQHPYGIFRPYPTPGAPIDLSIGTRNIQEPIESKNVTCFRPQAVKWYEIPETNNNDRKLEIKVEAHSTSPLNAATPSPIQAVDLSCRKRANHSPDLYSPAEKIPKTESAAVKPVKLFKPYLLDNEDPDQAVHERKDAIIWSNHPAASLSSPHYDTQSSQNSSNNNFQPSPNESTYRFPINSPTISSSPIFQNSPGSSVYDRTTPTSNPSSPANQLNNLLWCPKGSPVSGYETASTYSDTSEPNRSPRTTTGPQHITMSSQSSSSPVFDQSPRIPHCSSSVTSYSLNVKMEPIDTNRGYYNHELTICRENCGNYSGKYLVADTGAPSDRDHHRNDVQRWLLDHDNSRHHHQRHGIALYV